MACAVLTLALLVGSPAFAQQRGELASAQARTAQYVFIIDDSGSMSRPVGGHPAADPDRLAVFATRSTLSMLDDADEATIIRLNGPREADPTVPIAPLSQNRDRLERMLSLDSEMAAYAGAQTPCSSAFKAAKEQLNAAWRPNVAQILIFLTDGECTGSPPSVDGFLSGLKSRDDDLFSFYLLRFEGYGYSDVLQQLAERTGGQTMVTDSSNPAALLEPFASALSASQGYESYLLSPSSRRLDAHQGARRVRLLAVAPDKGKDLDFSINAARKGAAPKIIGAARKGVHQYEDGRRFRFAAVDYEPGEVPVTIDVDGAGRDWKVVAVPEYRLFVEMDVTTGECGEGETVGYAEVGSDVCAEIRLVNQDGEVVTTDIARRGTEALVRYRSPDTDGTRELPARRADSQEARFIMERKNLEDGDHIFRPIVRLSVPGQRGSTVDVKGGAHTLQVSTVTVRASPGGADFGTLVPGDEKFEEIEFSGNFPSAKARLVVQNRDDVPECVTFALSGKAEGEAQQITSGQSYTLAVDVAPYCGASSFKREFNTAVRVEFDQSGQMMKVPTLVLKVNFSLVSDISVPAALRANLIAGQFVDFDLSVSGNFERDARFKVLVPAVDERRDWPSKAAHLDIEFLDEDGDPIHNDDGDLARSRQVSFAAGGDASPVKVRAQSGACCSGGDYTTELALVAEDGAREPIRVPVELSVEVGSMWRCWGPTILWILAALLVILLALYVYNMWRNTNLWSKKKLIGQMQLLEWGPTGQPTSAPGGSNPAEQFVAKNFGFVDRLKVWLQANPLKIGLPNDYKYDETLRLVLNVDQPRNSSLKIYDRPDHYSGLSSSPRATGHVYASASHGFYAVPDLDGYVGMLRLQNYLSPPSGELEVVNLVGETLVVDDRARAPGTNAGWEIRY